MGPQIKSDLDAGTPVPLGVVTVSSSRPADLALNHQVLAYDYAEPDGGVTLRVYDANQGQRDDISIEEITDTVHRMLQDGIAVEEISHE